MSKAAYLTVALCLATAQAHAQTLEGLVGTLEVAHQRQQSRGVLEGCSMVFRAAFKDFAYRQGGLAVVGGNFTFYVRDPESAFLTIKAGLRDVENEVGQAVAPGFVYLQSKGATTAKAKTADTDSDTPGFRMWVMAVDADVARLIADVMDGESIVLGLTRKGGGLDVLVPLDLSTKSTTIGSDGTVSRERSPEAVQSFTQCFVEVAAKLKR